MSDTGADMVLGLRREGSKFGRYRLLGELGHGGMGIVYHAVNEGPQGFARACVIKRIVPHLARDHEFIQSLIAEARLSGLLIHPGIVQVYEFGEIDGEFYLAMEYVDGLTLIDVLQRLGRARSTFPPGLVCFMIAELAAALAYAHSLKDNSERPLEIVHRDVNPSNVMLGRAGTVKLLDFGIAKAATHMREEQTRTGTLKGKFAYMSPEQAEGIHVDHRSDLFSLGVVFWEALASKRLFRTKDDMHTLRLVREAKVEPTGVDPDIDRIVLKMLARNPDDRFSTGEEIAAALQPIAMRLHGNGFAMRRFLTDLPQTDQPSGAAAVVAPVPEAVTQSNVSLRTQLTPSIQAEPPLTIAGASGEVVMPPAAADISAINVKPASRARRLVGAAAAASVIALVALGLASRRTPSEQMPAAQSVEAPAQPPVAPELPSPQLAAPEAAAAPVLHEVRLQVDGTVGAEVFADGASMGVVPLDAKLPHRTDSVTIVVRKAGFIDSTQTIAGDRDVHLEVKLMRPAKAPLSKHKTAPKGDIKNPFAR